MVSYHRRASNANRWKAKAMTPLYKVIIADPPWGYANWSERKNGAAQAIYNTMSIEDLCAMPVSQIAAPDCVLLMWATNPKLVEAVKLGTAWGFEYVTKFPWIKISGHPQTNFSGEYEYKPHYGIGFWVRGCSEDILVWKRGNIKPPDLGWVGIISKQFQHSRKPDNLYEYAESLPAPRLEMFARRRREGWDAFGNECEGSIRLPTLPAPDKGESAPLKHLSTPKVVSDLGNESQPALCG